MPIKEISLPDDIFYVDGQPYQRKSLINNPQLRYYLSDCPELFNEIDNIKKPSHLELIKVLKEYHDIKCKDGACIIYKKKMPPLKIDIQPIIGLVKYNYGYNFSGYTKQFGFLSYLWMPIDNERLFFRTGIIYSKQKEKYIYL
jgi:hypothetical protein